MIIKHLSTGQNFLETCRVGSAHHRESTMNEFLQHMTLFWCAERTLPKLFEKFSCTEVEHHSFARVGGH
jgi:hypothetical protein